MREKVVSEENIAHRRRNGGGGEIEIPYDGVLYLRVNDSPAELHDNRGEIEVKLSLMGEN